MNRLNLAPINGDLFGWGSLVEIERRNRIRLSLWAFAYEFRNHTMVSDDQFDAVAVASNPSMITGRLDDWWRDNFAPGTGMWIHNHPELHKVELLYENLQVQRPKRTTNR